MNAFSASVHSRLAEYLTTMELGRLKRYFEADRKTWTFLIEILDKCTLKSRRDALILMGRIY